MSKMQTYTSIGRPLEMSYITNKIIGIITIASFVIALIFFLFSGILILKAIWMSFVAALSLFFAWAISRELDPDNDCSAFVGVGLMIFSFFLFPLPEIIPLLWLMTGLRLVNRTTGLQGKIADSIVFILLAAWLTYKVDWSFMLGASLFLYLDAFLYPRHKKQLVFGSIAMLLFLIALVFNWYNQVEAGITFWVITTISVIAALLLVVIIDQKFVVSKGDNTGETLNNTRIRLCQLAGLVFLFQFSIRANADAFYLFLPAWAAIAGISIFRIVKIATRIISPGKK